MIVDTSAIVAIVSGESGAQVLKEALERSPNSRMSAPNYVELCAIMQRRDRPEISRLVDRLLDDYGIQVEAVDADQARVAAQAYRDYGTRQRPSGPSQPRRHLQLRPGPGHRGAAAVSWR